MRVCSSGDDSNRVSRTRNCCSCGSDVIDDGEGRSEDMMSGESWEDN